MTQVQSLTDLTPEQRREKLRELLAASVKAVGVIADDLTENQLLAASTKIKEAIADIKQQYGMD